jgi:hypothetical protein
MRSLCSAPIRNLSRTELYHCTKPLGHGGICTVSLLVNVKTGEARPELEDVQGHLFAGIARTSEETEQL